MTTEATTNPLSQYFRLPGLNVALPTGGAFLPPGTFEPDVNGTVPIFPMRAADEYLLKNPDALLSGFAIQKMIESCVPAIKAPTRLSTPDLDVLLLAIRAATYGENMDVTAVCPKCKEENEFSCHLPSLLTSMQTIPPEIDVRLTDEIVVYIRPYTFQNASQLSMLTFQESRRIQGLADASEEVRIKEMQNSMEKITQLQAYLLADCVIKVVTPTVTVTDPEHIVEFMGNVSRAWASKIEERLKVINEMGMDKNVAVSCQKCSHEWKTSIEFDPSSFFDSGS